MIYHIFPLKKPKESRFAYVYDAEISVTLNANYGLLSI